MNIDQCQPEKYQFSENEWALSTAKIINSLVWSCIKKKGSCSVVLTGGESASRVYSEWSSLYDFKSMSGVNFYFGDERCVPSDDKNSNYRMVMNNLFASGVPKDSKVYKLDANAPDKNLEALRYSQLVPSKVDLLLLSLGDDGHIASIYPGNLDAFDVSTSFVYIPLAKTKPRVPRISLTPVLISNSKKTCLLISGKNKSEALRLITISGFDPIERPAQLTLNGIWIIDSSVNSN